MSDISRTTVGGVDYDDLLRGSRNYACNPVKKLTSEPEVEEIKTKLIAQLEQTIEDLESGEFLSDRTIAKVYIGKTYLQRKRKAGGGFKKFDPDDHHTWKKNGISSRWGEHKHKDYGRDGLVVLGAITRETVNKTCRGRVHQEDFALAMEQKLLHHYLLSHSDPKVPVVNETFTTGRTTKRRCIAYVIYMAFSYTEDSSSSNMYNNSEPGPSHTPPPQSPPTSSSKSKAPRAKKVYRSRQRQTESSQDLQGSSSRSQTGSMQRTHQQNLARIRSSGRRVTFAVNREESRDSIVRNTESSTTNRELVRGYNDRLSEIDPYGILDEHDLV